MDKIEPNENLYKVAMEKSPNAIVIHEDGICVFVNEAAKKLFRAVKDEDIVNKKIVDFIDADIKIKYKDYIYNSKNISYEKVEKCKFIGCDNKPVYAEVVIINMQDKYKNSHMILFKDETEEDLLDKKNQFFIDMSHELKTPLNVILSSLQVIDMYQKSGAIVDTENKFEDYSKIIKRSCYKLLKNINNLIDFNKLEYGKMQVNISNYDIVKIIEDIVCPIEEIVKNQGINFLFEKMVDRKIIACDKDKIERIILNLGSNAIKFTQPGGNITISIYTEEGFVCISTKDTGVGIPKDKQEAIFDRYKQVKDCKNKSYIGHGLGLAIVKSIVEVHEGEITVESEEGIGTNFIVKIPDKQMEEGMVEVDSYINTEKVNIEFSEIKNA